MVEAAKQRIQDKIDLKKKQEKDAEEEAKRDIEFTQQLQQQQRDKEEKLSQEKLKRKQEEEDEEEDPLDAYMKQITKRPQREKVMATSVKTEPGTVAQEQPPVKKKVNVVIGVVNVSSSKSQDEKEKGAIMEQDIDGLEYGSDEEDQAPPLDAMGMLNEDMLMSGLTADGQPKMKTKAEMVFTDHEKVYYRPFRKNFYVEVPEISKMTNEEAELYRLELEGIKVKGKSCPKPIKSWAQCGVSFKVMECLKRNSFEKPTPIQAQGIPIIMSGRDMIGIAKTGSGKTLAFVLPMFRHILDQPELEADDGPVAIIMTPTRELAMQIAKECKKFTKYLNLNVVAVYGGTNISEQIAELKRGAEIIVCTPGRMIDMLAANNGRVTNLRRVTYVVLDEADRMFDMGFEPQVNKILDNIRPDRQTVMFSATFPKKMEDLARKCLTKPIEVTVGGRSIVCKDVEQHVIVLEDDQKYLKLLELLGIYQEQGSVIVFVDKQENADDLVKNLLKNSYPCMALHGGVDQCDRESIMGFFKSSNMPLLIATSIAARGLDVKDLILVVNYDCPNHYEDYIHRCG